MSTVSKRHLAINGRVSTNVLGVKKKRAANEQKPRGD